MSKSLQLQEYFKDFPGIGPRQAKRFVMHVLRLSKSDRSTLARLISDISEEIGTCEACHRHFSRKSSAQVLCDICISLERNRSELIIVAHDSDLEAIEKSGVTRGVYFVLGKNARLDTEEHQADLPFKDLATRIKTLYAEAGSLEVVLATSANHEGDHTAQIIKNWIEKEFLGQTISIVTLGRGLSTGLELEYSDSETLRNAFLNRRV
jgi:recombination protein RecR